MFYELNVGKISVFSAPTDPSKKSQISGTVDTDSTSVKRVVLLDRLTMEIIGSCIVSANNTWKITGNYSVDKGLLALCFDEGEQYNADVFDYLSMGTVTYIHGEEWDTAIEPVDLKYRGIFSPAVHTIKFPFDSEISIEDIKSVISKFQFDTIGVSGHFEDSSNLPVTIGTGNTISKVTVGSSVTIDGEMTKISSIVDDGEGDNEVLIESVCNGQTYVYDIYGDSSCIFFAPLDRDPVTENVSKIYQTKKLRWDIGRLSYSLSATSDYGNNDGGIIYPDFRLGEGEYTFSFWIYPTNSTGFLTIFQGSCFSISHSSSTLTVKVCRSTSGATIATSTFTPSLTLNTWTHFVISIGTSGCSVWKNGAVLSSNSTNSYLIPASASKEKEEGRFSILCNDSWGNFSNLSYANNTKIRISHVRIFNKKITLLADAQTLYNEVPGNGGVSDVSVISNITNSGNSIYQNPEIYNEYSTAIIKPENDLVMNYLTMNSISPSVIEEPKFEVGFIKGNEKNSWRLIHKPDSSNKSYGFTDDNRVGGYYWDTYFLYTDLGKRNKYFDFHFPKKYRLIGMSFQKSATYQIPTKFLIYSSETGSFTGEEEFCGEETFSQRDYIYNSNVAGYRHTAVLKFKNIIFGKYFRFYIVETSFSENASITSSIVIGFQNIYFEVSVSVPTESRKARSVIIDIADCWGSTTNMGACALCFMLNGELVNTDNFQFYETSYSTTSTKADKCINPKYSWSNVENNGTYWLSASGQYTNQRLIAVAPKDFYFDDVFFINYHSSAGTNVNYGIKNITIRSTLSIITDTTYNSAVSGEEYVFIGEVPKMYSSATEMTNISSFGLMRKSLPVFSIGDKRKPVKVKALRFNLSSNYGDSSQMGLCRIEFWNKGVRYYQNTGGTWTYSASSQVADPQYLFNCNGGLYASNNTSNWLSAVGNPFSAIIDVVFPIEMEIDTIRMCNYMYAAADTNTDKGVRYVNIQGSVGGNFDDGDCFHLVRYFGLARRMHSSEELWSVIPLLPIKSNTWTAKSVVIDIHNNYGGSFTGLQCIRFLKNNLVVPVDGTLESSSETNYVASHLIDGPVNYQNGCLTNTCWKTTESTSRLIFYSYSSFEFDEIRCSNWWDSTDYVVSVKNGVKDVTVSITDTVLSSSYAVYNATIPGGSVIYNGGIPSRAPYSLSGVEALETMCSKDPIYYSTDISLLINSGSAASPSIVKSETAFSIDLFMSTQSIYSNNIKKIGEVSLYFNENSFAFSDNNNPNQIYNLHYLGNRNFEIGMWVYPLSTSEYGNAIISKWNSSESKKSFWFGINDSKLEFRYSVDGTTSIVCNSTENISINVWTWIGVKRNGPHLYLIINGVVVDTFTIGSSSIYNSSYCLELGFFDGDQNNIFYGYVDEIIMRLDGLQNSNSFTPVTSSFSITPSWSDIFTKIYFSFSFESVEDAYCVYNNGWYPIAIYSDDLWYFKKQDGSFDYDAVNNNKYTAISKGMENLIVSQNHKITASEISSLTATYYSQFRGYNSEGKVRIGCTFYKSSENGFVGLKDLNINNKKYWISDPIDLSKITATFTSSSINWNIKKDYNNALYYDDLFSRFKVYSFITGSNSWTQCIRGQSINGIVANESSTGKVLHLKTELDISGFKYKNDNINPTLFLEIN